jgi:hypothetical protein
MLKKNSCNPRGRGSFKGKGLSCIRRIKGNMSCVRRIKGNSGINIMI